VVTGLTLLITFGTDASKNCVTVSFMKIDAVKAILHLRGVNVFLSVLSTFTVDLGDIRHKEILHIIQVIFDQIRENRRQRKGRKLNCNHSCAVKT